MPDYRSFFSHCRVAAPLAALSLLLLLSASGCTSDSSSSGCRTVLNCKDDAAPICDATSLSCRACQAVVDDVACKNRSATTPHCGPVGRCVGCMSNSDCKDAKNPVCSSLSSCGPCQTATDCPSRICQADGSCAATSDVLVVNNNNGSCTGTVHTGAIDDPFCAIADAIGAAVAANKSFITVAPSTLAYDGASIVTVGGSGLHISSSTGLPASVQVRTTGTSAFTVTSPTGQVVLSGLDLSSSNGNGVDCSGGANLTVLGSRIHDSQNGIVGSNSCKLTLDGVRVYNNHVNGITLLAGSTYVINNIMVWSNRNSGISLASSTGTLRFATVYGNGNQTFNGPPGIDCGAGQNVIEDSIVYNNISRTNLFDNQMVGCGATNVVTDDSKSAAYGGTYQQNVDFVNGVGKDPTVYDLRLRTDSTYNLASCIDKITMTSGLIDHDIDGNKRPQGAGDDIGAAEVH